MGQGQADTAHAMLKQCQKSGDWLCLKNVHLTLAFLATLEKDLSDAEPGFRLWMTTEPHEKFPTALLKTCVKVTLESPPGVKKNLERTAAMWKDAPGPAIRSQIMFGLAFTHAVVQERRKYLPQGWSKFYEFSLADLRSALNVVSVRLIYTLYCGRL